MGEYTPNPWMTLPFAALLLSIALGPLCCPKWWTQHFGKVALGLGAITLGYYLFGLPEAAQTTVVHTAEEYFSFIALVGSLFVVSGGIHITVKGEATPWENVRFLFLGAVLANVLGTTGASMLLIRPWIRMNHYRVTAHHIVFFIFIVSNVGGCLTPVGDPPLFAGFLKGIPFWWVAEHCWPMWAVALGILLAIFWIVDYRNYQRAPKQVRADLCHAPETWGFQGLGNLVFLALILGAVFISEPKFVREAVMLGAAAGSWFLTNKRIHEANHFEWHPIEEVALLFLGIFATMMPALDWLRINAGQMGNPSVSIYYWGCGALSSVLDNMPTYLSFLAASFGSFVKPDEVTQVQSLLAQSLHTGIETATNAPATVTNTLAALQQYHAADIAAGNVSREEIQVCYLLGNTVYNNYIVAISVAAVFFGAFTYIGNGPNFMVKAIAEHQKVRTPGFLGYVLRYALPFLLPTVVIVWLLFFR